MPGAAQSVEDQGTEGVAVEPVDNIVEDRFAAFLGVDSRRAVDEGLRPLTAALSCVEHFSAGDRAGGRDQRREGGDDHQDQCHLPPGWSQAMHGRADQRENSSENDHRAGARQRE
ncbi:hypothetical protein OG598_01320 [Micromonospora sp. NBC_00330]|uniref:hypothetical protein n=1 Tax=Micromonospora sp. NBC_00330 TaxID=2903585 RepID=UPI002E283DC3|nr:hypothetical protein [Micromonospora sp. NBC_00330]